ncbi:MAG: class I SAM-dependent methyltransferase, partial [Halalkalicoccus sp.]|nr:class I SAM-dependent methyltransferase [Halalkalicoccus sp.]
MDESRTVRETYDRIAAHFASTREHPWPEVETFLEERKGALGLDIGCANGRHAELLAARSDRVLGVDVSRGLLREARERARSRGYALDLVEGDAATLPIRSDRVDIAVYVATIHHLRDRETRVRSLDELARVLAPDGRALVSAWSTAHDRFDSEAGFDTTIEWTLPGGETVPRFYHIYAPEELRTEIADSALALEVFEVSSGNCYATVRRE